MSDQYEHQRRSGMVDYQWKARAERAEADLALLMSLDEPLDVVKLVREVERLRKLNAAKDDLLVAYRLGDNDRGVRAVDRIRALEGNSDA